MQSQGLGFMEAVEQLAGEVGLDVPKPSPEAAVAEQRRLDVTAVLEAARLQTPENAKAVLARGVAANPTSARLWMQVAWLQVEGLQTAERKCMWLICSAGQA